MGENSDSRKKIETMISVVGIPFDYFSSFMKGSAKAPDAIRQAYHSDSANYFTESLINLNESDSWKDEGNLLLTSPEHVTLEIEKGIADCLKRYEKVLSLGGDHSVTYPIVKAFARKYGQLSIFHLDAHGDLYDHFEGNRYSHACPFARIMEEGLASRLVQVGIRTMTTHQREQANKFGVEVIEMKDWTPELKFHFQGPAYLSLDMDAIDPAFAPGVSHHEPGGFTSREIISLIQKVQGNFVGADLVEFNPQRDASGITAMLAAKLFKELLDLLARD